MDTASRPGNITNPPVGPHAHTLLYRLATLLLKRFEQNRTGQDLDWAIAVFRCSFDSCPRDDPSRSHVRMLLAYSRYRRFERLDSAIDLKRAAVLWQDALPFFPEGFQLNREMLKALSAGIRTCFEGNGSAVLEEMITASRAAVALCHERDVASPENSAEVIESGPSGRSERSISLLRRADTLWNRFQHGKSPGDLDESINLIRDAVDLCPDNHSIRIALLNALARSLLTRFQFRETKNDIQEAIALLRAILAFPYEHQGDRSSNLDALADVLFIRSQYNDNILDLDESIKLHRAALELRPEGHPHRWKSLSELATTTHGRFHKVGTIGDLEESIAMCRAALVLLRDSDHERSMQLSKLSAFLLVRFQRFGDAGDLDEAMTLGRIALDLVPDGHPSRSAVLDRFLFCLKARFNEGENSEDLNELITLLREILAHSSESHPDRSQSLEGLATCLAIRFQRSENPDDLNESIALYRDCSRRSPKGESLSITTLERFAGSLMTRFQKEENGDDLDESAAIYRDILAQLPKGHPDYAFSLNRLASCLRIRVNRGDTDGVDEVIALYRERLTVPSDERSDRSESLEGLATTLGLRFQKAGNPNDLNESISLFRDALAHVSKGHEGHFELLEKFIISLMVRFRRELNSDDLNEYINVHREALTYLPKRHARRAGLLEGLASSLLTRFERDGKSVDLNNSIALYKDVSSLPPDGNPDRSLPLTDLATSLAIRFQQNGQINDVEHSIKLLRAALTLVPDAHQRRPESLRLLAVCLGNRFDKYGNRDDVDEAIALFRDAMALLSSDDLKRLVVLQNLATTLMKRFTLFAGVNDLDEAVEGLRIVLANYPEKNHPDSVSFSVLLANLAESLRARFEQCGRAEDIVESIALHREALSFCPVGHVRHSDALVGLVNSIYTRFEKEKRAEDLEVCVQYLKDAAAHKSSSCLARLRAAWRWTIMARPLDHCSTLDAYRTRLSVLQFALNISPTLPMQHEFLTGNSEHLHIAEEAASYGIGKGNLTQAIEFLEQGRALMWSQMRGFRTPLDRLSEVNKTLADRLSACCRRLSALMTSTEAHFAALNVNGGAVLTYGVSRGDHPEEEMLVHVDRLTEEREEIIEEIRKIPGFEDFLREASFETLQQAASEGPVIVVNYCRYRCDAIIVLSGKDVPCVCVPLDENWYRDALELGNELLGVRYKYKVHSTEYDKTLQRTMKVLWDRVVSKVVQKLKELGIAKGSRIWWCPTSLLSFLPFHAAGPYDDGSGVQKYLLDDYISSYTPTLSSLISARSKIRNGRQKLLFIGDSKLPSTTKELHAIRKWKKDKDKFLVGENASRKAVKDSMRRVEWVHFACHGMLSEKPFESAFKLFDGDLTLLDIAKARLPIAELAFLSACHTAEVSPTSALDEVLTLAAGMQFCGFRSVIGTMWQLLDRDAPILTETVYLHLMSDLDKGEVRFKKAAAAVREAALYLRRRGVQADEDMKVERWVNLIHIGA